jgi:hypothetical protein
MKNISLIILALILTLTFTASDIVDQKGNKACEAQKCPYLESLQNNSSQIHCPYLDKLEKGNSACPYLNQGNKTQSGCPFLEGGSGIECPYLKQMEQGIIKVIENHPLPEGKNT